jgi:DNA modification methylase
MRGFPDRAVDLIVTDPPYLVGLRTATLKNEGALGTKEMAITALTPVWLDSKSRGVRDYYREGW